MLSSLSIKNYAIIRDLEVAFNPGFCVVTGETGAGKSIIMGALGLILGQRADKSVLNNESGKCIVEGKFIVNDIISGKLKNFFKENDLDYEIPIILRREITPSGKSRAFINDTPVQLSVIRELGLNLIDIHSQHSNLELVNHVFQLNVIDWYGGHEKLINDYRLVYNEMRALQKKHNEIADAAQQSKADLDYFTFQFKQLEEAGLADGEQEELEKEREMLTHSEEIKTGLGSVYQLLDNAEFAALSQLKEAASIMQGLGNYFPEAGELYSRLESQHIELQDISGECERLAELTEYDPSRLEVVNDRLNVIYSLQQKHRVETVGELIALRDEFDQKVQEAESYDEQLEKMKGEIDTIRKEVEYFAGKLHDSRMKALPGITKEIQGYLSQLGMTNAKLQIDIGKRKDFISTGNDDVYFLFSANKGVAPEEINKVASGGELSRLMLAIKTVVARSKALPAIIFDEIDAGISGEIATKMGQILSKMANYMQVINITHLPQIASKGTAHYCVFKNETNDKVETDIRQLAENERVTEVAKMLGGDPPHEAAIINAKAL
ncbi:MAG: DNA repair protein RecN, partial [Prolixibacteraceae bacterium]|nr:DNA repair protein RecN [Prolixibacteraceae bacterium]